MMRSRSALLLLLLCLGMLQQHHARAANDDYFLEAAENGAEKFVLMHSRMGIRIEYNMSKQRINLWISPQAGKDVDYRMRNFSNRDDHTMLFDKISFPRIDPADFVSCDYDPFHSVIHYTSQTVHILSLLDQPALLVWCEKPEMLDFKSDKADSPLERTPGVFAIKHPDRWLDLTFAAATGAGEGTFMHQRELDEGRSIYCRLSLDAGQFVTIAGELSKENVVDMAKKIAKRPLDSIIAENERKIAAATVNGAITIKEGYPEVQKLHDFNRRMLLSALDASGYMPASIKYIYYMVWTGDTCVTTSFQAYGGWVDPLRLWVEFALSNPTVATVEQPGRYFGQLINGKLSKREEYQIHPMVWAVYTYWSQTGDDTYLKGEYLEALEDGLDWMEKYCYDKELDMFFSRYRSEYPYYGSYDYGWDEAIGRPMSTEGPKVNGEYIIRSISGSMNARMYDIYMMMSAMTTGKTSDKYFEKAQGRKRLLDRLAGKTGEEPFGGYNDLEKSGVVKVSGGAARGSGRSHGFFAIDYTGIGADTSGRFDGLQRTAIEGTREVFAVNYFESLAGLDPEFCGDTKFWEASKWFIPPSINPSEYLPMPYAMTEMFNMPPGNYHDNRPQFFTIGAFQGALAHQGIKRMAFGIGLRGNNHLAKIDNYQYKDSILSIDYTGSGKLESITVNGAPLRYTYQIPEGLYKKGKNSIQVGLAQKQTEVPILVYSTVRLDSVAKQGEAVRYDIAACGSNAMTFKNLKSDPKVLDAAGREVPIRKSVTNGYTTIEFDGRGRFIVTAGL